MKAYLLSCLTLLSLAACNRGTHHGDHTINSADSIQKNPNDSLYKEVMAVHDEVMPKMDDIYSLKQKLKSKIAESPNLGTETKARYEDHIKKLDSASEGMMVWMRQFNPPTKSVDPEESRKYLNGEKEKIERVKKTMLTAIEQAQSELNSK